jgi:hypothetical protein
MRRILVMCLVVAALVAGCGSKDSGEDTFRARANANCAARQKAVRTVHKADARAGGWVEEYDRELAAQRKLEPPETLAGDWASYLESTSEYASKQRAVFEAIANRGHKYVNTSPLEAEANRAGFLARQAAKRMQLNACADPFT